MWSAPRKQGDLFEQVRVAELQPELRSRLTPLLRTLLAEVAQAELRQTLPDDLGSGEASDDQDHG
jgi:hypothetical protein